MQFSLQYVASLNLADREDESCCSDIGKNRQKPVKIDLWDAEKPDKDELVKILIAKQPSHAP